MTLSDDVLRRTSLIARGELSEATVKYAMATVARLRRSSADEFRRQITLFCEKLEEHLSYSATLVSSQDVDRKISSGRPKQAEEP